MNSQTRSRLILLVLAAIFFGTFIAAGLLRYSGWMPAGRSNYGELLDPPWDLNAWPVRLADGSHYPWRGRADRWRLLVFAPADCAAECVALAASLDKVWRTEGRHADRLHVLWFGPLPEAAPRFRNLLLMQAAPELRARLQDDATGLPVILVDPFGFAALRYPPGFDAAGLRRDLGRLIK